MTEIEKLVRENREQFDDRSPHRGHFRRFGRKIQRNAGLETTNLLKIAAIFILAMTLTGGGYLYLVREKEKTVISELPEEVKETLYYYNSISGSMITEIKEIRFRDEATKTVLLNDVKSYDKNYGKLISDLRKYPGDERVISALIEYHRSRVEFLQYIVNQLDPAKQGQTNKL